MRQRDELTAVGAILKLHGYKGELEAVADYEEIPLDSLDFVFVELDGLMVPFRITSCRPKRDNSLLMLRGIDSEEKAKPLVGKELFVENSKLPAEFGADDDVFYLADMIGFEAYDGDHHIGTITDFDDTTDNALFTVTTPEGKEFLIPAADDLITEFSEDQKRITFNLPIGLIDL